MSSVRNVPTGLRLAGILPKHDPPKEAREKGFLIDCRDGVDLDQATWIGGELHHLHRRRCRPGAAEELGPNVVEGILISIDR